MPDYSAFPVVEGVRTYLPAPDGYVVDFENPQQQFHLTLYSVVGIGNLLALLFMSQRIYTKLELSRGLQLEDGFLIASWICSLIVQGVTIWSVGIQARGVHGWEMPIERFVQFKFSVYIGGSVFMPCASFAKIALLVFYLRLSPQTWFKYACWATLGIITVYTPAIFLALLFACRPLEASWRVELEGDCIDNTALFIATCVVNSFTDVVLFLLPIPTVLGLRMPLVQKLGVLGVFAIGLITVATSVIRAAILPKMAGADQSWITASASVWSQLECNLLVICGTIPTLNKFLRHVSPKVLRSTDNSKSASTPNVPRTPLYHRPCNSYAQFGQGASELELTRWDETEEMRRGAGVSTTITTGSTRPASNDGSSDKAIMETRLIEQTVEHRHYE